MATPHPSRILMASTGLLTVALLGVWVVWHARRSRYADAFGSLLLALAAVAVSAVAFVAPDALARGADHVVLSVQTATAQ